MGHCQQIVYTAHVFELKIQALLHAIMHGWRDGQLCKSGAVAAGGNSGYSNCGTIKQQERAFCAQPTGGRNAARDGLGAD